MTAGRLTLNAALASGTLDAFIAQAEAAGIGPVDPAAFDRLLGVVTAPQPEGQTSHSPARDGSHGR